MFIIQTLVSALAVFITAKLLEGVEVKNFWHAILTAIVIGLANFFIKPVLTFLSFPITIITFGLFLWVINAVIILIVDAVLEGFKVKNFGWAIGFSIVFSIINWMLNWFL
ncbi:phage holin family protein [Flexithrix dorotheae]|uniref:phage holin family protein n=1 Tax=Flexithrix dorotheae TaxID=70993 RepID=UPI0003725EF1|nr:phage holin family protein [Flexithrix dorotheae]